MGAIPLITSGSGEDPDTAFADARARALQEHGHGGYTGSIAEKHAFVMITEEPMPPRAAIALADDLAEGGDERVADKRGPAGCIPVSSDPTIEPRSFVFFGWASW